MIILPSCNRASTIVGFYHLHSNEAIREKTWLEQYNEAVYSFRRILEAAIYKTPASRPLTSYLVYHP